MPPLNAKTLSSFGDPVETPVYDRADVRAGIVHFGVGGFHRAHQAMYLDGLMNEGPENENGVLEWGICGVGVLPGDRRMKEAMDAQDCLYTLVLKYPDGTFEPRVIGSIVEYLFAPDGPEAVIEKMAGAATRIVSLTVTEGGYNFNAVTGEFDATNPDVVHDVAPGAAPRTTFGLVIEGLVRRRERGLPAFTVLSCDNIQGNGDAARKSFSAFAALRDPELGRWVQDDVAFPNCMVDRITPVTTDEDRAEIARRFGVEDRWPVVCEPFTQWVLEDRFPLGRPPFEDVGVQVVGDVELGQYKPNLIARFSNPHVRDTVARLCAESSDRIPKWLLPVIRHNLATGGEIRRSVAVVASWARYAEGVDEQGQPIEVVDRLRDRLMANAR